MGHTGDLKLYLYYIGKARDAHANGMAQEFLKRTSRYMACEMREIVPARFDLFSRHSTARKVFLDPAGKAMDSEVFAALADPIRRDLVARLADGDATVGELAEPYDVSVQAVSKHLKVLEAAGLVTKTKDAQRRSRTTEPRRHTPPMHMYLISRKSSMPYFEPSRPMPDSLTPPNGATSVEMMPVLMPTMPDSMASATRQTRA